MTKISILDIVEDTTVDGPGFRTTIYCAGCPNHCPGCHNPQSWDIANGHDVDIEDILETILADPFADVTFSGGDPMFQPQGFAELARAIKERSSKAECEPFRILLFLLYNTVRNCSVDSYYRQRPQNTKEGDSK